MYTVCNQPFINLDQYVDIDSLMSQKWKFSAAIAKHSNKINPTKFRHDSFLEPNPGIADFIAEAMEDPSKFGDPDVIQNLINIDKFGTFAIFERQCKHGLHSLAFRYPTNFFTKHIAETTTITEADKDIGFFYDWLDKQNIFSTFGRVAAFINFEGECTPIHTDRKFDPNVLDEFIWINFSPNKKFFVYDPDTKEKTYFTGHTNWFHASTYHGCDDVSYASYSLRVDGIFSDEFIKRANLQVIRN